MNFISLTDKTGDTLYLNVAHIMEFRAERDAAGQYTGRTIVWMSDGEPGRVFLESRPEVDSKITIMGARG